MTSLKVDDLVQAKWVVGTANSGGSGWTNPRAVVAAGAENTLDLYRVVELYSDAFVVQHISGSPRIVVSDDRKVIPVSVLIVDDGKRYEGTPSYDKSSDGLLDVALAQCGHCGFVWNDELSTQLTPPPSGRCPNEYNHVYDEEEATPRSLTADEMHVLLDLITYYRNPESGEPWSGYDSDPQNDPKASAAGWTELLDSADIALSDLLENE